MIRNQKQFDQALDALPEWRRLKLAQALRALAALPESNAKQNERGAQSAPKSAAMAA